MMGACVRSHFVSRRKGCPTAVSAAGLMLRRAAAAFLTAALLPAARSQLQQGKIHPVDTRQILCDLQPGLVNISGLRAGETGNPSVPFVLSFFRSDSANVSFSFSLVDAEGTVIVENMTLALGEDGTDQAEDVTRRLAAGWAGGSRARMEERVGACDEFFLSDGREPVELPDTWAEARSAFNEVCLAEGLMPGECGRKEKDTFQGLPQDEELMETDEGLCDRLMRSILEAPTVDIGRGEQVSLSELKTGDGKPYSLARRLKGGGSSSGGSSGSGGSSASSNGFTGSRTGVREVGYSDAGRSAAFGGTTPMRTQYGYTGRSAYQRRAVPFAAGLSTSFMFWRMRGGGGSRGSNRPADCSADARFKECEFAACRPCASGDPEAAQCKTEPCASCVTDEPYLTCLSADCAAGSDCLAYLGDTVIRDDLMTRLRAQRVCLPLSPHHREPLGRRLPAAAGLRDVSALELGGLPAGLQPGQHALALRGLAGHLRPDGRDGGDFLGCGWRAGLLQESAPDAASHGCRDDAWDAQQRVGAPPVAVKRSLGSCRPLPCSPPAETALQPWPCALRAHASSRPPLRRMVMLRVQDDGGLRWMPMLSLH